MLWRYLMLKSRTFVSHFHTKYKSAIMNSFFVESFISSIWLLTLHLVRFRSTGVAFLDDGIFFILLSCYWDICVDIIVWIESVVASEKSLSTLKHRHLSSSGDATPYPTLHLSWFILDNIFVKNENIQHCTEVGKWLFLYCKLIKNIEILLCLLTYLASYYPIFFKVYIDYRIFSYFRTVLFIKNTQLSSLTFLLEMVKGHELKFWMKF